MNKKGIPFLGMILVGLLPTVLKRVYYRMRGARLGANVKFGLGSYVSFRELEMRDDAKIGPFTYVQVRTLKMGRRAAIRSFTAIDTPHVEMADDAVIMEQVVVGGLVSPRSKLVLGKRVKVFPFSILNPTEPLIVEDDAAVGSNNAVFTHGSWKSKLDGYPVVFAPVHIKKRAWLPWRVLVMPGVTIGEDAAVGGGSVVTKSIPDGHLAAGIPTRVIKKPEEFARSYSIEEKHAIVLDIMRDFAECLAFKEIPAELSSVDDGAALSLKHNRRSYRVRYAQAVSNNHLANTDYVVSLTAIDEATRAAADRAGVVWFDLPGKACRYQRSPVWT